MSRPVCPDVNRQLLDLERTLCRAMQQLVRLLGKFDTSDDDFSSDEDGGRPQVVRSLQAALWTCDVVAADISAVTCPMQDGDEPSIIERPAGPDPRP